MGIRIVLSSLREIILQSFDYFCHWIVLSEELLWSIWCLESTGKVEANSSPGKRDDNNRPSQLSDAFVPVVVKEQLGLTDLIRLVK